MSKSLIRYAFGVLIFISSCAFSTVANSQECPDNFFPATRAVTLAGGLNILLLGEFYASNDEIYDALAAEQMAKYVTSRIGTETRFGTIVDFVYEPLPQINDIRRFDLFITTISGEGPPRERRFDANYKTQMANFCPMGYEVVMFANQALCELIDVNYQDCPEEEKPNDNKGSPDDCVGNPVSLQTLTKRVQESDFEGGGLSFTRTYNGPYKNVDRVIKGEWTNSFSLEIRANLLETNHNPEIAISSLDGYKILLYRENGNFIEFDLSAGGQPVPTYSSHDFTLERAVDYSWWKVINDKDEAELYDVNGRLTSITSSNGRVINWTYDDSNGAIVTNSESGERLVLSYDAEIIPRLVQIQDPDGGLYKYAYNDEGMLQYVSYPDDTLGASGSNPFGENNPFREYHYENPNLPSALTGITDERGNRYSTWGYDLDGRVVSSEHVLENHSVDRVGLDYTYVDDINDPRIIETNALDKETIHHFKVINGVRKFTRIESLDHVNASDTSVSCIAANQHKSYDENGYKDIVTDWEGNVTDYDYDDRGLEVSRVEAQRWQGDVIDSVVVSTAATRTFTTEWHPDFRLPTKITEPDRVTVITYDPVNGRELSRTEYLLGNEP